MSALQPQPAIETWERADSGFGEPTQGAVRSRTKHLFVVAAMPLIVTAHYIFAAPDYTVTARIQAGLIACVTVACLAYAPKFVIPVLGLYMTRFYVMMGAPVFSEPRLVTYRGPVRVLPESYERALAGCLLFSVLVVLTCVAAVPLGLGFARRVGRWFAWTTESGQVVSGTFVARSGAAVCMAAHTLQVLRLDLVPGSLTLLISLLSSPSLSLCLLMWDAELRSGRSGWVLFWLVLIYQSLTGLGSGYLGEALLPALTGTALLWMLRGRIPWGLIVAGALMFGLVNPVKSVYRQLSWDTGRALGVQERIENWGIAFRSIYIDSANTFTVGMGAENAASRLSALPQIAHMFDSVPRLVPHSGAEPWLSLPLFYIPTVLWPDRPSYGREFNKEYGLIFDLQTPHSIRNTTLNLPCVGDGYWRLGWTGVMVEAAIMGLLLGVLQGLAAHRSQAAVFVSLSYVVALKPEAHVLSAISGLPQFIVFVGFILIALNLPAVLRRGRAVQVANRGNI